MTECRSVSRERQPKPHTHVTAAPLSFPPRPIITCRHPLPRVRGVRTGTLPIGDLRDLELILLLVWVYMKLHRERRIVMMSLVNTYTVYGAPSQGCLLGLRAGRSMVRGVRGIQYK